MAGIIRLTVVSVCLSQTGDARGRAKQSSVWEEALIPTTVQFFFVPFLPRPVHALRRLLSFFRFCKRKQKPLVLVPGLRSAFAVRCDIVVLCLPFSLSFIIIISFVVIIIIIIIIIIVSIITVFAGVLFVHQPGANHTPRASVTQVNHSVHTLSTFLRIRADPSMQIFRISVIVAFSDTFLMFSTIPFFTVPSAPTTTGITTVLTYATFSVFLVLGLYYYYYY